MKIPLSSLEATPYSERPDLIKCKLQIMPQAWPEFMFHDAISNQYWEQLEEKFSQFQFGVSNEKGDVIGFASSIPLYWTEQDYGPDGGWDGAIIKGFLDLSSDRKPNVLCALSITVAPAYQGQGFSLKMLLFMKELARKYNFKALFAPVRPSHKNFHPEVPIEEYLSWTNSDGLPFDPWVRTHVRLGGKILNVEPSSMKITGTIAEWEMWANMKFLKTGKYEIPGALIPIDINLDQNQGFYEEPNVWVVHTIF